MTQIQIVRSVGYGLAFWFAAAMLIHLAPALFDGGTINAALLAVSIPICWATMPVARIACGVDDARLLEATVIAIAVATFADGIGLTFAADALYAGLSPASQFGAAWILWGAGWLLVFAWQRSHRS